LRAELIDIARRPDPAILLAEVRERKNHLGTHLSAESILAHRDADRR
jgi:hypothetical protein